MITMHLDVKFRVFGITFGHVRRVFKFLVPHVGGLSSGIEHTLFSIDERGVKLDVSYYWLS